MPIVETVSEEMGPGPSTSTSITALLPTRKITQKQGILREKALIALQIVLPNNHL